ncbi:MAG: chemotaxis protein CheW [Rhodoferax sp.]|nr:chemotaxis protein CheW [Rhodoferax sp.]
MADTSSDSGGGLDLSQFHQVFFEEAGENLDRMEQQLLEIDIESADDETLNSIFRCAHSVKGGAATFGFADVAALTHQMETLLDKLRRHELEPNAAMVDVLLQSGDALKAQLALHQSGGKGEPIETAGLLASYASFIAGEAPAPAAAGTAPTPAATASTADAAVPDLPKGQRGLELLVGPLERPADADQLVELFAEIVDLGTIEPLDGGQPADGMRRFKVVTGSTDDDLLDLFTFHVARDKVKLLPLGPGYGFHSGAPGAPPDEAPPPVVDNSFGFFDDAPGAPGSATVAPVATTPVPGVAKAETKAPVRAQAAPPAAEASTLRVSVEKVDQLINLVGELVITQAMLAQTSTKIDLTKHQQLVSGLADLERHTRDLQESVMSIRMIPMSMVYSRFPRMLRDLAAKLNKKVDFVTHGESTELDKGLVEKITDPLTHLVRNSCDHGIEMPAERRAAGKPETGTITLAASHQGGSIVIEVRDDGKGLSRPKLIKKARERGIDAPDDMSDADVWSLIFAPGFSTAEVVTDVSGRGVGMDVVKKNITALGGTVEIESAEGFGMSVRVRLPLTLAIMDGMSVGVNNECYILPLASVVESFQVQADTVRTIGGSGQVVRVREEYLPVVELERVFDVQRNGILPDKPVMVVVEAEGRRAALLVDELLGQQQVVVKNLEANYRRVSDVSGATIMGDGRVALILDVGALARRGRS